MAKKKVEKKGYDPSSITVLEGLEAVRVRPSMYIGDTGERGLHHLISEVVDNSIDEAMAGYCKNIKVSLHKNGSATIEDDGRGIPTGIHPQTKTSALEVVMCTLHAGGKFEKEAYVVSGGLHGVGVSVVNALSEWCEVEVQREGKIFKQEYKAGVPQGEVKQIGKSKATGTKVTFYPDKKIFKETTKFKSDIVAERLQELAYLNANVKIVFHDGSKQQTFHYKGGIKDFVAHLSESKNIIHKEPIFISDTRDSIPIEFAFQYNTSDGETCLTYVNSINTTEGGTHHTGMKVGLTRALNEYAYKNNLIKNKKTNLTGDDFREGFIAVISVKVAEPQFEGQTKTKLGNSEVKGAVEKAIYEHVTKYLESFPNVAKKIIDKAVITAEARMAAKRARELTKRKNAIDTLSLPTKLMDCASDKMEECELFLVEGDSAAGSAKMGRDRKFQAILPLKGKIMNVEKAKLQKILENEEIQAMISAIGCGIGSFNKLDMSKLRYNKIIIMTDADVDGSHIRCLILTFLYRFMKDLIDAGHVYVAQAPLFKIKKGKVEQYAWSEKERNEILAKLRKSNKDAVVLTEKDIQENEEGESKKDGIVISRFKGLGEMNPDQLWSTTLDPSKRTLLQVGINNAAEAEKLFSICMGEYPEARRNLIEKYADKVRRLDV